MCVCECAGCIAFESLLTNSNLHPHSPRQTNTSSRTVQDLRARQHVVGGVDGGFVDGRQKQNSGAATHIQRLSRSLKMQQQPPRTQARMPSPDHQPVSSHSETPHTFACNNALGVTICRKQHHLFKVFGVLVLHQATVNKPIKQRLCCCHRSPSHQSGEPPDIRTSHAYHTRTSHTQAQNTPLPFPIRAPMPARKTRAA